MVNEDERCRTCGGSGLASGRYCDCEDGNILRESDERENAEAAYEDAREAAFEERADREYSRWAGAFGGEA